MAFLKDQDLLRKEFMRGRRAISDEEAAMVCSYEVIWLDPCRISSAMATQLPTRGLQRTTFFMGKEARHIVRL